MFPIFHRHTRRATRWLAVSGAIFLAPEVTANEAATPPARPVFQAPPGQFDRPWLGINASWYPDLRRDLNELGVKGIRLNWGWIEPGKPDGFAPHHADEKKLRPFVRDGFVLSVGLMQRGTDLNGKPLEDPDFEKWVANYKEYCRQVMSRYGKPGDVLIASYLVGNEPDINEVAYTGNLSPYQAMRFTQAMWEAHNEINPALQVQSPPVSRPDAPYLRDLIQLGIDKYCDAIGMHAYVDQMDDARFRKPWEWLREVGVQKPISISESGTPLRTDWGPKNMTDVAWRERWHAQAYVQTKRFGYSRLMLFTHTGGDDWVDRWAYRDRHKNMAPIQTAHDAVQFGMLKRAFANGGFESANHPRFEWMPVHPINAPDEPKWADFAAKTPRSGQNSLSIQSGMEQREVRRIVPDLQIGKRYTISAYAKTSGTAQAILGAQGFNARDGLDEKTASTTPNPKQQKHDWQRLRVSFVPTNSWVVISLGAASSYNGQVHWDDVSIQPS